MAEPITVAQMTLSNGNGVLNSYSNGTFIASTATEVIKDFKAIIFNSTGKISRLSADSTNVLADYVQDINATLPAGTTIVAKPGVVFDKITLGGGSVTMILK